MGPTIAEIDHVNLTHNFNQIRGRYPALKIMAIVKANAYGHGVIEITRTLSKNGTDYFGVAFPEEGIQLREAGIKEPILVLGAMLPEYFEISIQNNLDITLSDPQQIPLLRKIARKINRKINLHIKIDTGMKCVGFSNDDFFSYADEIFSEPFFNITGIYTHFSSADEEDLDFTRVQLSRFNEIRTAVKKRKPQILFHSANSAAIMKLPESHFDMVRPGTLLYGNPPDPDFRLCWDLREVMTFKSKISMIRNIKRGDSLGYNRRYTAKSDMKAALVSAGYADGFSRHLSNKGEVLIRGRRCRVIGNVCMDRFLIDIKNNPEIKAGEEVILFGRQADEHIKISETARLLGTIPYEVTCQISARVSRVHKYESKEAEGIGKQDG
jgi:alanine racemase